MSSDPCDRDRELDDFLAGRDPLSRAYRDASAGEHAPPALDAAILDAARAEARKPLRRRPGWLQPLALAATLALSLGVLLDLWRDPQTRSQMLPAKPVPVPVQKVAPQADAETESTQTDERRAEPERSAAREAPKSAKPLEAVPKRTEPRASVMEPQQAFEAFVRPAAEAGPQSAPAAPPTAPPESAASALLLQVPDAAVRQREQAEATARSKAEVQARPAEAWFEQIRTQLRQGDVYAARTTLRTFRAQYPQLALPEDLRELELGAPSP